MYADVGSAQFQKEDDYLQPMFQNETIVDDSDYAVVSEPSLNVLQRTHEYEDPDKVSLANTPYYSLGTATQEPPYGWTAQKKVTGFNQFESPYYSLGASGQEAKYSFAQQIKDVTYAYFDVATNNMGDEDL